MTRWTALILMGVVACISCQKKESTKTQPVLVVNGEPIPFSAFLLHYNRAKQELPDVSRSQIDVLNQIKQKTLNKLIFEKLIEQEAKKKNIVVTEQELSRDIETIQKDIPKEQFAKNLSDQLLTMEEWTTLHKSKLLADKVARVLVSVDRNVTDEEIRKFYEENKAEYFSELKVRARQIYVKDEGLAEDLLKRVKKGAKFEDLAKAHSLSPDADKGGDLGLFAYDSMIPEFNVAFNLKAGEVHPTVIKSPYGFHILKTESIEKARQLKPDEVKELIRRKILEAREEIPYKKWLEELVKNAKIEKNEVLISEFDKPS